MNKYRHFTLDELKREREDQRREAVRLAGRSTWDSKKYSREVDRIDAEIASREEPDEDDEPKKKWSLF